MNKNNAVIEMGDDAVRNQGAIVAKLPREHLKSLFYLFAGKPDSRVKVYHKPLFLDVNDICELNECITRKLQTHNIDAQITSLNVGYKDADIQEFGSWVEFQGHHWQTSDCVEEVVIKWDFMVDIKSFDVPQRHTLLVRVSSDMKPGKFMQMMAAGNADDFDQVDMLTAPAFCRVDFINAQISKELINEVTDWVKGRREPALITDFYYWFKKRRQILAEIIHHSIMLMYAILWVSSFSWVNTHVYDGNMNLTYIAIWLFLGLYAFTPIGKVAHAMASRVYIALDNVSGRKVAFEFTSGDKKINAESINENRRLGKNFLKQTSISLLFNVIAGIISTYLYVNS